jgi:predicted ribosomally synthesized peptide with SipW-like signal peptide
MKTIIISSIVAILAVSATSAYFTDKADREARYNDEMMKACDAVIYYYQGKYGGIR